LIYII